MPRLLLLTGLLCLLLPMPLTAQPAPPWPPDPEALFTDVVRTTEVEPPNVPQIDDQRMVIRVYNAANDMWREYPLPANVDGELNMAYGGNIPAGYVWLYEPASSGNSRIVPQRTYALNLETGTYTQPEAICGDFFRSSTGRGEWVYYVSTTGLVHLCFTEDGTLKTALPAEYDWIQTDGAGYFFQPQRSPDGAWLIISGVDVDDPDMFSVFSYEVATDNMNLLGQVNGRGSSSYLRVDHNNWTGLYLGWMFGSASDSDKYWYDVYYTFDVTQAGSLRLRFTAPSLPLLFPTEGGFEFLRSPSQTQPEINEGVLDCEYKFYGPQIDRVFRIANDCLYLNSHSRSLKWGDRLLLLTIESPDDQTASLIAFNPADGSQEEILSDAGIERVLSVSPDGRYMVLITELDDQLNPQRDGQTTGSSYRGGRIVIYDSATGQVVPITPGVGEFANQAWWIGEHELALYMRSYDTPFVLPSGDMMLNTYPEVLIYVALNAGRLTRSITYYDLEGQLVRRDGESPGPIVGSHYFLLENETQPAVLNVQTQTVTPLIRQETVQQYGYAVQVEQVYNGTLRASVSHPNAGASQRPAEFILELVEALR